MKILSGGKQTRNLLRLLCDNVYLALSHIGQNHSMLPSLSKTLFRQVSSPCIPLLCGTILFADFLP